MREAAAFPPVFDVDDHGTGSRTALHPVGRVAVYALCVALALVVIGLLLGIAGLFSAWAALPLALLSGYGLSKLWRPVDATPRGSSPAVWWLAAVVAIAAFTLNAAFPSEQYIGGRDGGTYLATGAWLADNGDLLVDARQGAYAESADLEFGGPGFFDSREDGRLRPQFLHGFPVVVATGKGVGGDWLMLRVNALLGGLALLVVFGFARLFVGSPLALLVEATLAANLVFSFYARAPFSEILALIFIFGGLWALWDAWEAESRRTAVLAGLLLGGSLLVRLDNLLLLIPLVAYLAYVQRAAAGRRSSAVLVRGVWRGLLPMITLAFIDLIVVTPDYLANHRRQAVPILVGVAIVVVADGLVGTRIGVVARRVSDVRRDRIAWMAGGALLAFLAFAYLIRPLVQEVPGAPYLRLAMDPAELAAGEERLFSENSARWLGWYLGPVAVLAGFGGWAWLTSRVLTGRRHLALPFLLMFSTMALLYLWRPSINPDHIWAMRRFLPLVIPGLLVMGAFLLQEVWDAAARWRAERFWRAGVGVLAVGVFAGSLLVFAPLADLHEFDGLSADLQRGCDLMGDDAAVLIADTPGGSVGSRLAPTYRSHCNLPAAYTTNTDGEFLEQLQGAWEAQGRNLWLLTVDRDLLDQMEMGEVHDLLVGSYDILELTFTRRPADVSDFGVAVYAVEVARP